MENEKQGKLAPIFAEGYKCTTHEEKCEISQSLPQNQGDLTPPTKLYLLELEFTAYGYKYSQVLKTDEIVIYQAQDESITFFEIFKPRIKPVTPIFALRRQIAEGYTHFEKYPSSSDFGS